MPKTAIKVGPADHGRRMSLDDFNRAEGQEGYLYELSRGVVTVVDVPNPRHLAQVLAVRRQLTSYQDKYPEQVYGVVAGSECKILLAELESERHPDLAVYKTPPPDVKDVWSVWVPELIVEVVSPGSEQRDYREKPEEYLDFGVKEYWIVNARRREMLALRRSRGRWAEKVVGASDVYETKLFPGLKLELAPVFRAAGKK